MAIIGWGSAICEVDGQASSLFLLLPASTSAVAGGTTSVIRSAGETTTIKTRAGGTTTIETRTGRTTDARIADAKTAGLEMIVTGSGSEGFNGLIAGHLPMRNGTDTSSGAPLLTLTW